MNTRFKILTTLLFLVFFSTSVFAQTADTNSNIISVKIEGMHCAGGCAMAVQKTLNNTDGVLAANVDFGSSMAMIEYNSSTNPEEIITLLSEMRGGAYQISLISSSDTQNTKKGCSKGKQCCKVTGKMNATCEQKSSGCCAGATKKCPSSSSKNKQRSKK